METLYHRPILEMVYLLTSMYEQVYVMKPNASNVFEDSRYLVCKKFRERLEENKDVNFVLPAYFLNKIEDSNIIIGHNQLEHYDQLITILKHKNMDEKIETAKKNNIQKCVQWCEKYKVPSNKFVERMNIFLPI
jgi:hypothetical protein